MSYHPPTMAELTQEQDREEAQREMVLVAAEQGYGSDDVSIGDGEDAVEAIIDGELIGFWVEARVWVTVEELHRLAEEQAYEEDSRR